MAKFASKTLGTYMRNSLRIETATDTFLSYRNNDEVFQATGATIYFLTQSHRMRIIANSTRKS